MIRTELENALRRLDYAAIADATQPCADDEERYLAVRARLILGRYDEAEALLLRLGPGFSHGSGLARFLAVQVRIFRREDRDRCLIELFELSESIPGEPYMRGEYYFILGYLHNLLDEYKQGSRYHRLAVSAYLESGRQACAGVALFNLCVAFDHLNARDLLAGAMRELSALSKALDLPSVRALALHFVAYRAIDREEYADAIPALLEVLAISQREGRRRESGAITWLVAYAYLKLDQAEALASFLERMEPQRAAFPPEYRHVLAEITSLAGKGIVDGATAEDYLRRWKRLCVDSIPLLFLTDLLLDRLLQGMEYEMALKIAHQGHQAILKRQMALSLLDFRYVEALARLKLGDEARGRRLHHAYRHDALEAGSRSRLDKAAALEARFPAGGTGATAESSRVTLDVRRHELLVGETRVNLSSKARVENLLEILIRAGRMLPLEDVFLAVYGQDFSPERHEARVNSLIARVRSVVGHDSLLLRRDGKVGMSPDYTYEIRDEGGGAGLAIERRHQHILRFLRGAEGPVRISDLERLSDFSRRTLQLDLKHLVDQGLLEASGQTKARLYRVRTVS